MRLIWRLYSFRHRNLAENVLNTEEMELSSLGKAEERNMPDNQEVNVPGESWTTVMIGLEKLL